MTQKPKRPTDMNKLAKSIVDIATGEADDTDVIIDTKNKRKAGQKGGIARAVSLTPEQREEIAKVAASARWKKS